MDVALMEVYPVVIRHQGDWLIGFGATALLNATLCLRAIS
jgi:hypothetical protein